jgi:hypothetical protein
MINKISIIGLVIIVLMISCTKDNTVSTEIQYGCTNSSACNYNPLVSIDNGTCIIDGFDYSYEPAIFTTADAPPYGFSINPGNCSSIDIDLQGQYGVNVPLNAECVQSEFVSNWWVWQWTELVLTTALNSAGQYDCNGTCGGTWSVDNFGECNPSSSSSALVVNEYLASSTYCCSNEDLGVVNQDFVEFMNVSSSELDISGWIFGDDVDNIGITAPEGTIVPAGELLVIWFSGNDQAVWPETDNKLSSDGETIWVATSEDGDTVIELQYNSQDADVSQQRCPNGFGIFQSNIEPSPGMLNICE